MVHVYMTNVTALPDPTEVPDIMKGLSEERKQKILRYRQPDARKQSLGAGLLLKQALSYYEKDVDDIRYGANGKPEIEGICFNLSHSHDIAVCAVSDKPVGCDVEKVERKAVRIADRFFTNNEITYLNGFEEEQKQQEFIRLWTIKESYMKMTGEGLSLGLSNFEIVIGDNIEIYRDGKKCSCKVREYNIPGYKLTVCAEEAEFAEIGLKCEEFL